ncbi:MAG: hypothetical protein ACRDPS_17090 [Nocardioides sp.]|uniref:hypothetical protein n=1 Tax=Nocardioides sp. TaxID=35761 RepID=UPI003D6AED14
MSDSPSPSATDESNAPATTATEAADPPAKLDPISRKGTPEHRTKSKREGAGRRQGMPVQAISLSVPASLAAQWKTYSQQVPRSLVDVLLDAVAATRPRLPVLLRAHQAALREKTRPVSDGTFMRNVPQPKRLEDPYVTMPLRLLATNVDVLDAMVHEMAAESRSQLVVVALTAWLADRRAEEQIYEEQLELEVPEDPFDRP